MSQAAGDDGSAPIELAPLVVEGSQVELAPAYHGGQVASGSRAGLLGNLDVLDMPFSGAAYTHALIENQQADSVGDVLLNDPTVRVAKGFGNFQEVYLIRGFPVFSDDLTL
ncbi:MAG: TonB-dependent siderophore receptor, partial [Alphaproteobacteria bacterium]